MIAIGHAWAVLGDSDKRGNYDRFGIDSESSRGGGGGGNPFAQGGFAGHPGFEGQLSPEDILRMFMGGGGGFGGPAFSILSKLTISISNRKWIQGQWTKF